MNTIIQKFGFQTTALVLVLVLLPGCCLERHLLLDRLVVRSGTGLRYSCCIHKVLDDWLAHRYLVLVQKITEDLSAGL